MANTSPTAWATAPATEYTGGGQRGRLRDPRYPGRHSGRWLSIDPGTYPPEFGLQSEIYAFMPETGPYASFPVQRKVVLILSRNPAGTGPSLAGKGKYFPRQGETVSPGPLEPGLTVSLAKNWRLTLVPVPNGIFPSTSRPSGSHVHHPKAGR